MQHPAVRKWYWTGIHLSSYGKERPEDQENLLTLIQAVHQVDGIERIRLGSLEPGIITEEFAAAISSLPKCARIFICLCRADVPPH